MGLCDSPVSYSVVSRRTYHVIRLFVICTYDIDQLKAGLHCLQKWVWTQRAYVIVFE